MAISDNDYKLLWGRSSGICSNPGCREDLTILLEGGRNYNVGEMAHVIAKSADGPRGVAEGGSDSYANLLLLCPTCHRRIDKAPMGEYSVDMLSRWKEEHEGSIRNAGAQISFSSRAELQIYVSRFLMENYALWERFGPRSFPAFSDPGSNLHEVWTLRKLDTIVPNNHKIVNAIEANFDFLSVDQSAAFQDFKLHASAFERHQYRRLDTYPLFPQRFQELFTS